LGLERARALPATTLRAGVAKKPVGLPEALAPRLPGGSCTLEIAPDPSDPSLARVRLEVTWKAPGGNASEQGEALLRVPAQAGGR
ncbi:MAG: hypothetical protein KIS92_12140, partial [Planctomycetota bacterium]|nr:hypothetical protein [Planctomycetota bacterium]